MKRIITFILFLYAGISAVKAQQYFCQPYYSDNKLRFYTTTSPVASSPFYTLDLSADVNNAWGETASGPNEVVIYNNKVFVSFDLGGQGGVLIYNLSDIYPTRTANAPVILKPQTANGLSTAGIAINPATGDLFIATFNNGTDDSGVYQYTAASGYTAVSQFASYFNDNSVAQVCANLAFDAGGNLWMTTWQEDDNAADHFLICFKGLNKNNYYKITNTATASYSAKDVSGATHTGLNLLSAPEGIAFDPSGNLFLSNNNDFALTNPAGEGTFVKFNASWLSTLLASPSTGTGTGNPTYTAPAAQVNIMYIASSKPGGLTFNSSTLYVNDQGQNQGDDYTSSGTVWQWNVTTGFNTTNFKASGIHTTYPGNGSGAFVTLTTADATLSALTLSSGTLTPVFASATTGYTASVANTVTSITETPTANTATSTIKVDGASVASGAASASLPLTVGANTITTVVTANDGVTTKTYTVTVTRAAAATPTLAGLTLSSGTLTPGFAAATTSYTASVANTVTSLNVTPTAGAGTPTIKVNGVAVASGTASAAIALAVGANTITTVVTAGDGVTTQTYTVTVTRAAAAGGGTLYYCQPYYTDNKLRFYTTTNPVASSPFYTLDVSADVNNAWGEIAAGPNDVVVYNNKVFVSFDLGDRGGVLIYNLSDIYPTRTATAPIVIKPQTTNGLQTAGIAINPANGDLFVPTLYDGSDDAGVYQYTAASGYTAASQFSSYFNDESVAQVCANLAFDDSGNLWMTTWDKDDDANAHFLICYKGLNKNNYYKVTNTATASYSATDVGGTIHTGLNLLSAPEGIAFDASGNLWLANNNDFALTNPAGAGTFVKFNASWLTTLLGSPATGSSAGNPTYTVPAAQVNIMYIAGGKPGGLTFNSNVLYIPDQGQNQGTDYTASGTVWQWNITTGFNAANFKASGIHTTYPGNGGGAMIALQASADATLSALTLSNGTLTPAFAAATTNYTASVGNGLASMTITPTATAPGSTITVNGTTVTSGSASQTLPLVVGPNTITTVITAQDGVTTKTYTLVVSEAKSTNDNLSAFKPSTGSLTPIFAAATTSYTESVASTVTTITITPATAVNTSTVTINGIAVTSGTASAPITLNTGTNTITGIVTAQSGATKTYTLTVTKAAGANAALSGLTLSNGTLTPAFAGTTTSYTAAVGNGLASMTITPTSADPTATITVNGTVVTSGASSQALPLVVGPNTITIIVTASDGVTKKTYTLVVTEAKSTNDNLSAFKPSTGSLTPIFAAATTSYTESVPATVETMTMTPTTAASTSTVTINGVAVKSGTASAPITLNTGANTITGTVTAQSGATKTYTLTVTKAAGANTNLSALTISNGTLTPAFAAATTSYTASVGNGLASMTITPTAADPTTTLTVNGKTVTSGSASQSLPLVVGPNTITTVVTATDNTKKTYTLVVTEAKSSNANLSLFRPSTGSLTPVFSASTTSYTESVANSVSTMTVIPTAAVTTSTITVNGAAVTSGTASSAIALSVGANTITTIVTAQNATTKTYTLTVTRAAGGADGYVPIAIGTGISVTKPTETPILADDGILVHQAVSPNGDGINDFLQIDNIGNYPDNRLSIMSRNGQLIYEAQGYDNSSKVFDGHSNKNGQMQLPGTYFYQLDYTINGITKHKTGFLVLKY